ncbi:hypothetical protein [Bacillus alkalicellulosilyticus]|uniref:hypothetical protein n=1 Tax=Alkalihalobacterium alkalicellulosilyticum TaxID=1912214 RepID=UPI0011170A7B|nr:hypothetical protein [Bacillus alkalicellulosilyticus]
MNGLNNSDIYYDEIVHFEIKDNFVFVFYTVANRLFYDVFDLSLSNMEHIGGGGSLDEDGGISVSGKSDRIPYYFSYFISNNPEVEQVEVHGNLAKNVKSKGVSLWIIFSDQNLEEADYIAYDQQGNQVNLIQRD